jgi:nitroreductase
MADYDDLMEIMKNMRAMRRLHPDPVPDELIRKILQAGLCAPNGGNTQRWRFLVIKDTKIKQAVRSGTRRHSTRWSGRATQERAAARRHAEQYDRQHAAVEYLTDHFHEAPVWIVACLEEDRPPTRWSGASIYPAVQNMLLGRARSGSAPRSRRGTYSTRRKPRPRSACRPACAPTRFSPSATRWEISGRSAAGR